MYRIISSVLQIRMGRVGGSHVKISRTTILCISDNIEHTNRSCDAEGLRGQIYGFWVWNRLCLICTNKISKRQQNLQYYLFFKSPTYDMLTIIRFLNAHFHSRSQLHFIRVQCPLISITLAVKSSTFI